MANYLYNGMELPALPKTTYPIAVMNTALYGMLKKATLYLFSELEYTTIEGSSDRGIVLTETNHVRFTATATNGEWTAASGTAGALNINNIGWANTDILNADGTLYLAASEPVPITAPALDPLSLFLGWKAGNWVARQRGKKVEQEKTPIAYLYNGVRLPDINAVWTDKEKYHYAVISSWYEYDGAYVLFLTDGDVFYVVDSNGVDYTWVGYAVNYAVYVFAKEETGNAWLYQNSNTTSDSHNMSINGEAIWCNNAVFNLDGSVYLAASEPVPVYE